ncbi:uncharacterized protein BP01DRAFT_388610 [Aspergillus saccharolyticus JOP 1030-1]|uniref:Uncharacterized protein n=1 Tax=Aspergillus saccharolyticus JOP 1030-1 TaxID=1450539 RepID=A0A318ZQD9_9EURO|nr:hypothetical protein BP01DRAFT_388610 [Aspergillus saccharolyticus JOP 1030-1]PYH48754.1 hypothetical protein BP01DRAFT_388610 [Aspergillus saccharolyticus JOP 1030-1]
MSLNTALAAPGRCPAARLILILNLKGFILFILALECLPCFVNNEAVKVSEFSNFLFQQNRPV